MEELTGPQIEKLVNAALTAFNRAEMGDLLMHKFTLTMAHIVSDRIADPLAFTSIVAYFNGNSRASALMDAMEDKNPHNLQLRDAIKEIRAEFAASLKLANSIEVDPHDLCILEERVFMNRSEFRDQARQLTGNSPDSAVIVVNGPANSGKTFTREFVNYLAFRFKKKKPVYLSLKDWPNANCLPDDLMDSLKSRMALPGTDYPPDDQAQGARRALKLVNWFIGMANSNTDEQWIIIDDLDDPGVPEETIEFINRLVKVTIESSVTKIKLVLLGYNPILPQDVVRDINFEILNGIDQTTVKVHARDTVSQYLNNEDEIRAESQRIADDTLEGLSEPFDKDSLVTLSCQFDKAVYDFLERTIRR